MLDLSTPMPSNINTICLDLGNVIFRFDIEKFVNILSVKEGHKYNTVYSGVEKFQKHHDSGLLTFDQAMLGLFPHVAHLPEKTDLLDFYRDTWIKCVVLDSQMEIFIKQLKSAGIKIAFLSNMGELHWKHLSTTYPDMFSGTINYISCLVGVAKPSYLYFQSFLSWKPEFSSSLYLDDRIENIDSGNLFGLNGYQFDLSKFNEDSLFEELDKINTVLLLPSQ